MVKHQKFSKYYDHECSIQYFVLNFSLIFVFKTVVVATPLVSQVKSFFVS